MACYGTTPLDAGGRPNEIMRRETVFSADTSSIKFGPGVTREVGFEMRRLGSRRVMVVTDPNVSVGKAVSATLEALRAQGVDAVLFDKVRIEPPDVSFKSRRYDSR